MEALVDKSGRRVFINQPQPDQYWRNLMLYDPNGYSNSNLGLYDRTQQPCQDWENQFYQFQLRHPTPPAYYVDKYGRNIYPRRYASQNFVNYGSY
jgi:hypothetical protein